MIRHPPFYSTKKNLKLSSQLTRSNLNKGVCVWNPHPNHWNGRSPEGKRLGEWLFYRTYVVIKILNERAPRTELKTLTWFQRPSESYLTPHCIVLAVMLVLGPVDCITMSKNRSYTAKILPYKIGQADRERSSFVDSVSRLLYAYTGWGAHTLARSWAHCCRHCYHEIVLGCIIGTGMDSRTLLLEGLPYPLWGCFDSLYFGL